MRYIVLFFALALFVSLPIAALLVLQVVDYWATLADAFGWWGLVLAFGPAVILGILVFRERRY